jgi:hypothetical protein
VCLCLGSSGSGALAVEDIYIFSINQNTRIMYYLLVIFVVACLVMIFTPAVKPFNTIKK